MSRSGFVTILALAILGSGQIAPGLGIDTGLDAIGLEHQLASEPDSPQFAGWMRIRGIADPTDSVLMHSTRDALERLHTRHLKTCVLLRLPTKNWKRKYLPEDLRETYANSRKLGAAYGDLVDAWEVDNEPDLGFVPEAAERYAAFLKATYLGLKAGIQEGGAESKAGLVLMGSLGLPPGPWLERFAANDGFAYTDGYNYHYYGYSDDFSAVYKQHERAVADLGGQNLPNGSGNSVHGVEKTLPVFMTEIGYGMLDKQARDTKDGRLRQWRWFKSISEQIAILQPDAPMAFYLQPYLEYDISEYGLAVAPLQKPVGASGAEMAKQTVPLLAAANPVSVPAGGGQRDLKPEGWTAGGINYTAKDFAEKPETGDLKPEIKPWMKMIGGGIGGNEATPALAWWLAQRATSKEPGAGSYKNDPASQQPTATNQNRSWAVATSVPSPIVLDFLAGDGLSPIKRYHGSFVTGLTEGSGAASAGASARQDKEPETKPAMPGNQQPTTKSQPAKAEEFMVQVRTQNGNLYEVYPTRLATPEWQQYLEPPGNFTMSFYGRAELPWRFKDNRPRSLVLVFYPKQLPATFEFRWVRLIALGTESKALGGRSRYGRGKIMLYNLSNKPVSGRLILPATMAPVVPGAPADSSGRSVSSALTLLPNERREVTVIIQVAGDRYERIASPVLFTPDDKAISPARFVTSFIPDIGGMNTKVVAGLLRQPAAGSLEPEAKVIAERPRATEEAPMTETGGFFGQQGAQVTRTPEGLAVIVSALPPGKPQRIEVELPWPDGLKFAEETFLSLEYRLR
ncbi:hypothetical protein [Opitutus sp. GAS368]|uniref:hypothetical protein n=1 Tax=Opitutus sp. GAS368 TaxID=1882749 RepID=UPI000879A64B|nr:hypothetical protein [Opitutus sp. GAS368]SDS46905.1 hypothetical protein SAMN05444173_2982 [Opitutus sp. GAS368]